MNSSLLSRVVGRIVFPGRFRARWERLRARGPLHFVLVRGVLGWGGSMFVVMLLLLPLMTGQGAGPHPPAGHRPSPPDLVGFVLALSIVGGLVWGASTWFSTEACYRLTGGTEGAGAGK